MSNAFIVRLAQTLTYSLIHLLHYWFVLFSPCATKLLIQTGGTYAQMAPLLTNQGLFLCGRMHRNAVLEPFTDYDSKLNINR